MGLLIYGALKGEIGGGRTSAICMSSYLFVFERTMTKRTPAPPPQLVGFTCVKPVGSGGYADVYLYEQAMPARQVAIKVLDPTALPAGAGQSSFTDEANLMAKVSAHPYIVQVFSAAIAPDGRPYLIMEYYPGPNFYDRARKEQMSVDEVLRVGIQVASAVETAHRAGVLHRDIKPANVLTSEYRRPGLTDFGIAAAQGPGVDTADGVSIPWSSPEALGEQGSDRRADVYSLAATVYTLLSGRAPFEITGGDNRPLAMMSRIERNPVPSLGRTDAPPSLERLLARAMAKDPAHRPQSAADFGRELQAVEAEMRLAVTPLELAGEQGAAQLRTRSDAFDAESTRVKGITEIRAQEPSVGSMIDVVPAGPAGPVVPIQQRRREGMLAEPEIEETVARRREPAANPVVVDRPKRNKLPIVAAAITIGLAAIVGLAAMGLGGSNSPSSPTLPPQDINVNIGGSPAQVGPRAISDLRGERQADETIVFTWKASGDGVEYSVEAADAVERVSDPRFVTSESCINVTVVAGGQFSDPVRGCAP